MRSFFQVRLNESRMSEGISQGSTGGGPKMHIFAYLNNRKLTKLNSDLEKISIKNNNLVYSNNSVFFLFFSPE